MAWIESHQSLARHRKTLRAAGLLRVDRYKLIGHLHQLWWWAIDNVPVDGDLGDLTDYEIAAGAEWDGGPEEFVQALTQAGFVDMTERGRCLHEWYEYAGKLLERREQDAVRKRESRRKRPPDIHRTSSGNPAEIQRMSVVTQPNSTEPNAPAEEVQPNDPDPLPAKPSTPDGWDELLSYVQKNRLEWYTTHAVTAAMVEAVEKLGAPIVRVAVEQAVLNGAAGWSYVNSILVSWMEAGLKTEEQARAAIQTFQRQKARGARARDRPAEAKPQNSNVRLPVTEQGKAYYEQFVDKPARKRDQAQPP